MPLQHRRHFTVLVLLLASAVIASTALVRAAVGTTSQISVSSTGQGGNELSRDATISADGRFVAFVSGATNLVAGDDNGTPDVFVRDRLLETTERVPLPPGVAGTAYPAISGTAGSSCWRRTGPSPTSGASLRTSICTTA